MTVTTYELTKSKRVNSNGDIGNTIKFTSMTAAMVVVQVMASNMIAYSVCVRMGAWPQTGVVFVGEGVMCACEYTRACKILR